MNIVILLTAITSLASCMRTVEADNQISSIPMVESQIITSDTTISFEDIKNFTPSFTGKKQTLNWQIVSTEGNNVVAQTAKNEGDYFNLLVLNNPIYKDLSLSVKIKALAGTEDQGGGLVWRYIDNNNYYIARCNPLENNFRFYKVVNGNRKQLKSVDCTIKSGEWFIISISIIGNKITCSLNDNKMIETTDDTYTNAGRVGLWTKADAQSQFDDLKIQSIK